MNRYLYLVYFFVVVWVSVFIVDLVKFFLVGVWNWSVYLGFVGGVALMISVNWYFAEDEKIRNKAGSVVVVKDGEVVSYH